MSEHDEIKIESDPTLPQSIKVAQDGWGNVYGLVHKHRMDGEFCQRRTVKLGEATYANIQQYLMALYCEGLWSPDYLFLSEGDYEALHKEVVHYLRFMISCANSSGRIVKFANPASGKYIHLATLPNLQEGEVMVLYPYE